METTPMRDDRHSAVVDPASRQSNRAVIHIGRAIIL
jgi:hypothetical protein